MNPHLITRKIHYCWFGSAPLPPLAQRCIASWKKHMPEYEIVRWDESNCDLSSDYAQICMRNKKWAFLSDYVRFQVLHQHGGIYLDVDVEIVKPLDPLLHHPLFLGWESNEWINASVIGAQSGNEHAKRLAALIEAQTLESRKFLGIPKRITAYLRELSQNAPGEVALFDPESFYPYNPWDTTRAVPQLMALDITDQTFAIHHWQHSWKDDGFLHYLKRARNRLLGTDKDF